MPKVTYDSDIIINRKPASFPAGFYMSVVVLQELLAGAEDDSRIKKLEQVRRKYEEANRLLIPTLDD